MTVGLLFFILFPLILSNIFHMLIVKKNIFTNLAKPISASLFGKNKTWRGFLIVPLFNAFFASTYNNTFTISENSLVAFLTGGFLGLIYILSELPNSYLKRSLGIPPGQSPSRYGVWFMLLDKMDSTFGVTLVACFLFSLSMCESVLLLVLSVLVHAILSLLLVLLKIKKSF